jgi:plasmid stabilization system protein ParE
VRVRVQRRAVSDYVEIREWLALASVPAAQRFEARVSAALDRLEAFPESGTRYLAGTRRMVVPNTTYAIIYSIKANDVVVRNIAHTSRKPGYWLERS